MVLSTETQIASDKATSAYITATTTAGLAVWSSNAASIASRDALTAYSMVLSLSQQHASSQTSTMDPDAAYTSNGVWEAAISSAAALARKGVTSNVLYPVRAQATFGSNAAASAESTSAAAAAAALEAVASAAGARSNTDRALVLASGSISSAGGCISGDLHFGNVASIRGLLALGIGSATPPQYLVHVASMATEEDVSIWVAGQIQQMSDRRDKADIERIDSAIDKLMAIRGYTYRHMASACLTVLSSPCSSKGRFAGVLAQEVQVSLPEAVHIHPETNQMSMSYSSLIPLLIEAIHELVAAQKENELTTQR
ncbi:hypothetical protein FOA52_009235 [Chlamydomonas sp. UWO 241]|nr:hypothetical protein FOA52_009235 [Chlamydomonas sp. UWO 241]